MVRIRLYSYYEILIKPEEKDIVKIMMKTGKAPEKKLNNNEVTWS